MNINLHIERLVLDGLSLGPGQGAQVKDAVETELSRLLTEGGITSGIQGDGELPTVRADSIVLNGNSDPLHLGQEIARSVYGVIGKCRPDPVP